MIEEAKPSETSQHPALLSSTSNSQSQQQTHLAPSNTKKPHVPVTSPIFNAIPVTNTSTPSSQNNEQKATTTSTTNTATASSKVTKQNFSVQVNKNEIKAERTAINNQRSNNQGFIKIIRNDVASAKKSSDSTSGAIEELDKCIAQFETLEEDVEEEVAEETQNKAITSKTYIINSAPSNGSSSNNYLSSIDKSINSSGDELSPNIRQKNGNNNKMSTTVDTIEFISPDHNNNNNDKHNLEYKAHFMKSLYRNAYTMPSKVSQTSLTSSVSQPPPPPPPPPPMAANAWLSLNANSNGAKTFLRSKNNQ